METVDRDRPRVLSCAPRRSCRVWPRLRCAQLYVSSGGEEPTLQDYEWMGERVVRLRGLSVTGDEDTVRRSLWLSLPFTGVSIRGPRPPSFHSPFASGFLPGLRVHPRRRV